MGKKYFELIEFDENEELLGEIRKHPIGLLIIELTGVIMAIIVMLAAYALIWGTKQLDSSLASDGVTAIVMIVGVLLALGVLGVSFIGSILYKSNVIFVTNEKIAQVLYKSIFDRTISQLSIGDVQDVTVTQKGLLARYFNYGTLVIETAGEQQNYTFTYVPSPYETAKLIVGSHETNLKQYGN